MKNYAGLGTERREGVRIRKLNPIIVQLLIKVTLNYTIRQMQNSLSLRQASLNFSQISTSVILTPIAVASMRCVIILLDRTHARVKQDTQEMEEHALVSRFDLFL